jgi:hypothetical protein
MIRMREPMRGHASLGGMSADMAASTPVRAPNLVPFPSGSIARRAPLESSQLRDAALDVIKLVLAFLFILVTGLSFVAGLFLLFFVRL